MANAATPLKLPVWKKLVFAGLLFIPAVLLIEMGLRLCGFRANAATPQASPDADQPLGLDAFGYFTICDRKLGFRNRPNGRFRSMHIKGNPVATTDEFGYRNGYAWPGDGRSPIVLFIGDSITFCSEVNDDETGPSEVAKLLSRHFRVRVLNAGVRGYGMLQSKRMLIECLQRFPEIVAAVFTHCGNDIEESMVPNLRYPAKAPVVMHDAKTGRFREVELTGPVVAWGQAIFPWDGPIATPEEPTATREAADWLATRSVIAVLCLETWDELCDAYPTPREFPAGIEMPLATDLIYWHAWALRNGGEDVSRLLLAEMDKECRDRGVVFLTTDYLTGLDDYRSDRFAELCGAAGVRFASIDHQFAKATKAYVAQRVSGEYDGHYSAVGTKAYAAGLAPVLQRILPARIPVATPKTRRQRLTAR